MNRGIATYGFAGVILGIVAILVIPLPPLVLDALFAFNIMASGVVLLMSITIAEPLEFAAFAPTLLIATLLRLALELSATRLILTHGHIDGGVGSMIPAFGAFVVGGNLVVGVIVFAILITIQFIVIASGSQRVAEVAARFTLDAMPGKQMAIDADVHAGVLDSETARRKRAVVQAEADFYGAMDGAGKFVKGDAIAALTIVVLNLVGGIIVGVAYDRMNPIDALNTFAILTIGNALLTTLPAFLLSTAMGLMVTRASADGSLGLDLMSQILRRPDVLRVAAGFALALALVPALPQALFVTVGLGFILLAAGARRHAGRRSVRESHTQAAVKRAAIRRPEMALSLIGVDALSIDVGSGLAPLLTGPSGEALLDRIGEIRRMLAAEIGLVIPGVRLRDDLERETDSYAIRVRDVLVGEGRLRHDVLLAVADDAVLATLPGDAVREPVYGLAAKAIAPADRDRATSSGALVFDPISIIGSHLAEVVRAHAAALLGRQELATLLEHLRASVPALVKEIGPEGVPPSLVQRVFENLLRERVWPRDAIATLEAVVDAAQHSRDPRELTEAARRAIVPAQLRRRRCMQLEALIVAPEFDAELETMWRPGGSLEADPQTAVYVRSQASAYAAAVPRDRAAVVCSAALRPLVSEFLQRCGVPLDVYAFGELPPALDLRSALLLERPALAPA